MQPVKTATPPHKPVNVIKGQGVEKNSEKSSINQKIGLCD